MGYMKYLFFDAPSLCRAILDIYPEISSKDDSLFVVSMAIVIISRIVIALTILFSIARTYRVIDILVWSKNHADDVERVEESMTPAMKTAYRLQLFYQLGTDISFLILFPCLTIMIEHALQNTLTLWALLGYTAFYIVTVCGIITRKAFMRYILLGEHPMIKEIYRDLKHSPMP